MPAHTLAFAVSPRAPGDAMLRLTATLAALVVSSGAWGQGASSFVPTLGVTLTATDNRQPGSGGRGSELITQISPGFSLNSRRGPIQGSLTYALNGQMYASDSSRNSVFHALSGVGRLAVLDGRAGVDATASAGRQIVSPFGVQTADPNLNRGNQAQVVSYSLAPYLNGRLLGEVDYRLRAGFNESRSDAGSTADTRSLTLATGIGGRLGGQVGWGLDYQRSVFESSRTARSHTSRLVGSLSHQPDVTLQWTARAGAEIDDVRTGRSEQTATWGLGIAWAPGPRTSLRANYDRRFFGNGYLLTFSHRMASTIWTASSTRDYQTGGVAGRALVSAYDLFFAQFASIEPDPIRRDALVRAFLAANGLDAGSQVVTSGYLSSSPRVQRSHNLTAAYQGLRSTATVSLVHSDSTTLSNASGGGGATPTNDAAQTGLALGLSHRLDPVSSLSLTASQQHTKARGTFGGSDLQSLVLTWSTRLGPQTSGSLSLRHSRFDNDTNPYNESAVIGSLRMQF